MKDIGTRLRRLPDDTFTALAFFSRVPVQAAKRSFDLSRSSAAWPVAGLILAIGPAALLLLLSAAEVPSVIAALLTLAAFAGLTGGMHEDGLADVADGFGGGGSREKKLAIMRDSRLGSYGALALIFIVTSKVAALAEVSVQPLFGATAILCAAALSRAMALWHWNSTLPARRDGFAWSAGRPDWLAMVIASGFGVLAAVPMLIAFGPGGLVAILAGAAVTALFSRTCVRQIGGHTGDTIGAAQQIAETVLLVALASVRVPNFL